MEEQRRLQELRQGMDQALATLAQGGHELGQRLADLQSGDEDERAPTPADSGRTPTPGGELLAEPPRPQTAPAAPGARREPPPSGLFRSPLSLLLAASPETALCSPSSPPPSPFHSWDAQTNVPVVNSTSKMTSLQISPHMYPGDRAAAPDTDTLSSPMADPAMAATPPQYTPSPLISLATPASGASTPGAQTPLGETLVLRRVRRHDAPTLDLNTPPSVRPGDKDAAPAMRPRRQLDFPDSPAAVPARRLNRKVVKCTPPAAAANPAAAVASTS